MTELTPVKLSDLQFQLAYEARRHPVVVSGVRLNTARRLEAQGWGSVEDGASSEMIFRLNQDGEDALPPLLGDA